ncbi:TraB/GumN family protein [Sphingopyxis sp.]|uniref:TraB/GumN family protein n=1 Tax=Sphingopyxis sp. TaxID=1908224 RepID=UPI003D0D7CFC
MKTWFKTFVASCAVVPFAACALAPGNAAFAKEPATASATTSVAAKPGLWTVKDADTTIYLFGTVHVLKPGLSWFDGAVKQAFDKSDEMVLEMVLPEDQAEAAKVTMPLAMDKSGKTLSSKLDPEALKAYQAALGGLGVPVNAFDAFKPWFAAVTLSILPLTKLGYDPTQGAEMQLTAAAKAATKPISGFETLEEQLGFFDSVPEAGQIAFLNVTVKDIDKLAPQLDKMVALWAKGDTVNLAATMNEGMAATPELAKILLWDRNERWADQIKTRMDKPGTVFIAVGAGHLAGTKSVQDYLKARGLKARRVQ